MNSTPNLINPQRFHVLIPKVKGVIVLTNEVSVSPCGNTGTAVRLRKESKNEAIKKDRERNRQRKRERGRASEAETELERMAKAMQIAQPCFLFYIKAIGLIKYSTGITV